jgi:outer membrane receptor protein involved in Fe transport
VGTEYRRDSMTNTTDGNLSGFQLAGTGGPTIGISGAVKVTELFMEGRIPIAQDRTGLQSLSVDLAYRYSDYGDVQTDTYKTGLEWAPTDSIRFRGSYQRAVRAANIVELFTAQGFNLFDLNGDPCGAAVRTASDAACLATGVPQAQLGSPTLDSPAGQYNFLQGGFTGLQPEESDTMSAGIILTPSFAPGLSVTVDWFNIQIDDTISTFGQANTLSACYDQGDQDACGRINRNENGSLWVGTGFVEDLNTNIGSLETTGVDVNLVYRGLEIGSMGSLGFDLTGTFVEELVTDPGPLTPSYDCVGKYSAACETPVPELRTRFRTSWMTPWDFDLTMTWRHLSGVTGVTTDPNVTLAANRIDRYLPAEDYFDLAANWQVTEQASLVMGINNILDDDPSLSASVGTTGNGNTFPQTYDAMGRYVFLRATIDF